MSACYLAGAGPSVLAVVKILLGLPLAAVAAAVSLRLLTAEASHGAAAHNASAGGMPAESTAATAAEPAAGS